MFQDLMRPRIAVGGLDADLLGDGAGSGGLTSKRAKLQQRKMDAEMSFEFDPNKRLRKGGKSGTNSFKSKKRYKRR